MYIFLKCTFYAFLFRIIVLNNQIKESEGRRISEKSFRDDIDLFEKVYNIEKQLEKITAGTEALANSLNSIHSLLNK